MQVREIPHLVDQHTAIDRHGANGVRRGRRARLVYRDNTIEVLATAGSRVRKQRPLLNGSVADAIAGNEIAVVFRKFFDVKHNHRPYRI